jgi:tRNA (cytosine38-C5)-methyltransferase
MDLVVPADTRSLCFTKGYAHYHEGTGSVLTTAPPAEREAAFAAHTAQPHAPEAPCPLAAVLQLRYFAPREIANLLCFPAQFTFPATTTVKQQRRLLGNSVNVRVLTTLLLHRLTPFLSAEPPAKQQQQQQHAL